MGLVLVTPPTIEPTTVSEVKSHCRISDSSQDDRLDRYIASARQYAEEYLDRQLITATYRLTLDRFPNMSFFGMYKAMDSYAALYRDRLITIPRPPLASVSWVKYYDIDYVQQTFDSSNYVVDADGEPGRLQLKVDKYWPVTAYRVGAVQIQYVTGYGATADDVPQAIRLAIEMLAAHFYENREAVAEARTDKMIFKVPLAVDELLNPYRTEQYRY